MKYYNEAFGAVGIILSFGSLIAFVLTSNYYLLIPWIIGLIMVQAGFSFWGSQTLNPFLRKLFSKE